MRKQLLHIYRNTPAGREILLASKLMGQRLGLPVAVWIPKHSHLNLSYGVHEVVVTLDAAYLRSPETAEERVASILGSDCAYRLIEPQRFKDRDLPELPTDFRMVTCPRAISDHTSRVSLGHVGAGHIGPAVRAIVKGAIHPVLIPGRVFSPWHEVAALYGGSTLGLESVRVALSFAERCDLPLSLFTHADSESVAESCERALADAGLLERVRERGSWQIWRRGTFADNLMEISRDALTVIGGAGHAAIREVFVTSKLKRLQTDWPRSLLVIGPKCAW